MCLPFISNLECFETKTRNTRLARCRLFQRIRSEALLTMCIVNYDRLPTRNRLASWGISVPSNCPFCSREVETRDHMLLFCEYSFDVWSEVFNRCYPPTSMFTDWSELLSWIWNPSSKKRSLLRKMGSQIVVYHLWKMRNNLIHNQISLPASTVFQRIDDELRNIISSTRFEKHHLF